MEWFKVEAGEAGGATGGENIYIQVVLVLVLWGKHNRCCWYQYQYWYCGGNIIAGTGTGTGEENIYTGGIKEHKDVNVDEHKEEFHADMHSMSEYS